MKTNLVDIVWEEEKPSRPCNQLIVLSIQYSGNFFYNVERNLYNIVEIKPFTNILVFYQNFPLCTQHTVHTLSVMFLRLTQYCTSYPSHIGQSWKGKVSDIRLKMKEVDASVVVLTALDEVACKSPHYHTHTLTCTHTGLLNLRGSDIDYNPLFFAFAMVTTEDIRYVCTHS